MSNKAFPLCDFTEGFYFDEDDSLPMQEPEEEHAAIPDSWTIVNSLNYLMLESKGAKLSDEFWRLCEPAFAFLTEKLTMSKWQVLFISIMSELGKNMSWLDFSRYLGTSRLSIMAQMDEMERLVKRRWITVVKYNHSEDDGVETYKLAPGVMNALSHNRVFEPEILEGMDELTFMRKLGFYMSKCESPIQMENEKAMKWMLDACEANPQLRICQKVLESELEAERSLMLLMAADYASCGDTPNEGITIEYLDRLLDEDFSYSVIRKMLVEGSHPYITDGWVEPKCEEGMTINDQFVLSRRAKEVLFAEFKPTTSNLPISNISRRMKSYKTIQSKKLYYNVNEERQINRLADLLTEEKLKAVRMRLEEKGMRKGFSCLFYGSPGTGKTETAYQLARLTGRDIMEVNIAGMRDKYVGESEKNIKAVFNRYRVACEQCEMMPILLFNEADALINKRSENTEHSVDKMDNAMQNIILQEMENLDGILIATTNLTSNLDSAFDRRFLFKVEFKKPTVDVKAKIWHSMLEDLSSDDALRLANGYDFSGGQIENIARKQNIEYILSGEKLSFELLENFCKEELLDKRQQRSSVGFRKCH
ncbi:MAG: ATP-binding protein [Paludibacteraceae bacterium]|nr:ATP-binding protein [Paludibacteraceae bacterium]